MPAHKSVPKTSAKAAASQNNGSRPRGRPRREIDLEAVADTAARLFNEQGYDAVSIEAVAEELSVSRATLYRTVPAKEDLLGMVLERSTAEVHLLAETVLADSTDPREALFGLIRVQVHAAIRMRNYLSVFFGGTGLPPDTYARWRKWAREYEELWVQAVRQAMDADVLEPGDPKLTARLLLGMIMWISRWYSPSQNLTGDEIADAAIKLVRRGTLSGATPTESEPAGSMDSAPRPDGSTQVGPWGFAPPLFSDRP
ncbi:TetR/AcrR family transcriptional regulator [Nocardia sp. NPDC059246]|uniref:TetR/AcrR family transcriptional regulator n=1 Tax=Nocardia sp. NPDC059246 TaxID=3346789 RepID=UPI00369A055F